MKHYLDLVKISAKEEKETEQDDKDLHCPGGLPCVHYLRHGGHGDPEPDVSGNTVGWLVACRVCRS